MLRRWDCRAYSFDLIFESLDLGEAGGGVGGLRGLLGFM